MLGIGELIGMTLKSIADRANGVVTVEQIKDLEIRNMVIYFAPDIEPEQIKRCHDWLNATAYFEDLSVLYKTFQRAFPYLPSIEERAIFGIWMAMKWEQRQG
jgi:hypothetical protein